MEVKINKSLHQNKQILLIFLQNKWILLLFPFIKKQNKSIFLLKTKENRPLFFYETKLN